MNGQFELNENSRVKQSIVICHMHTLVSFFLPHHWAMQNRFNHKAINACLNTQFSFDMKTLPFFFSNIKHFFLPLLQFSSAFLLLSSMNVLSFVHIVCPLPLSCYLTAPLIEFDVLLVSHTLCMRFVCMGSCVCQREHIVTA